MDYQLVSAAVLFRDNKVLVQKRPEGKPLAGFYEFPGGKVEKGETFEECIIRELGEELDVEVPRCSIAPLGFICHDQFIISALIVGCKGEPKPMIGQELEWVHPVQLIKMNMLPSNFKIVEEVLKAAPTKLAR